MEPPALSMHHLSRIQQQFSASTPSDPHAPSSPALTDAANALHQRISSSEFSTFEQLLAQKKDRMQPPSTDELPNASGNPPAQQLTSGHKQSDQKQQQQSHPLDQVAAPPPTQTAQPQQQPQAPQQQRTGCTNCGTVDTPLWRRDNQGKTICNACGESIPSVFIPSPFISSFIAVTCQRVARLGSRAPVSSIHAPC